MNRRDSFSALAGVATASLLPRQRIDAADAQAELHIAINTYPWLTFARRDGKQLELHDEDKSRASIDHVLSIAERAKQLGTRIIVTIPSPIRWGGTEDKTDQQLQHQAKSLDRLGASLRKLGITLAYHNHDSELRQGTNLMWQHSGRLIISARRLAEWPVSME